MSLSQGDHKLFRGVKKLVRVYCTLLDALIATKTPKNELRITRVYYFQAKIKRHLDEPSYL